MSDFQQHTIESAPEASSPLLAQARKSLGFVPNLYGVLAESPTALHAYVQIGQALDQHAALSAIERNIAAIAMSRENRCSYCVAAHSTIATMVKAPDHGIAAAREGRVIDDARLEAVRRAATALVERRGRLDNQQLADFFAAGFEHRHLLDLIAVAALKTLSNYTNHLADPPLDDAFCAHAWPQQ